VAATTYVARVDLREEMATRRQTRKMAADAGKRWRYRDVTRQVVPNATRCSCFRILIQKFTSMAAWVRLDEGYLKEDAAYRKQISIEKT
jgi:hypothetical protein